MEDILLTPTPDDGPLIHTCGRGTCTIPIGDGDYASGHRQCVWHRGGHRRDSPRR